MDALRSLPCSRSHFSSPFEHFLQRTSKLYVWRSSKYNFSLTQSNNLHIIHQLHRSSHRDALQNVLAAIFKHQSGPLHYKPMDQSEQFISSILNNELQHPELILLLADLNTFKISNHHQHPFQHGHL